MNTLNDRENFYELFFPVFGFCLSSSSLWSSFASLYHDRSRIHDLVPNSSFRLACLLKSLRRRYLECAVRTHDVVVVVCRWIRFCTVWVMNDACLCAVSVHGVRGVRIRFEFSFLRMIVSHLLFGYTQLSVLVNDLDEDVSLYFSHWAHVVVYVSCSVCFASITGAGYSIVIVFDPIWLVSFLVS